MSYSRWAENCDWYIFWHTSDAKTKDEELLSVWHCGRDELPNYSYLDIKEYLRSENFTSIPGYEEKDRSFLKDCFEKFVGEVDGDYLPPPNRSVPPKR